METKMFLGMFVLGLVNSQRLHANVNKKLTISEKRMAIAR